MREHVEKRLRGAMEQLKRELIAAGIPLEDCHFEVVFQGGEIMVRPPFPPAVERAKSSLTTAQLDALEQAEVDEFLRDAEVKPDTLLIKPDQLDQLKKRGARKQVTDGFESR